MCFYDKKIPIGVFFVLSGGGGIYVRYKLLSFGVGMYLLESQLWNFRKNGSDTPFDPDHSNLVVGLEQ